MSSRATTLVWEGDQVTVWVREQAQEWATPTVRQQAPAQVETQGLAVAPALLLAQMLIRALLDGMLSSQAQVQNVPFDLEAALQSVQVQWR